MIRLWCGVAGVSSADAGRAGGRRAARAPRDIAISVSSTRPQLSRVAPVPTDPGRVSEREFIIRHKRYKMAKKQNRARGSGRCVWAVVTGELHLYRYG